MCDSHSDCDDSSDELGCGKCEKIDRKNSEAIAVFLHGLTSDQC